MGRGDLATACPALEESQRLDPGVGTLLNVAVCHEQSGRTATAWTDFEEALAIAEREGQAERAEFAREHMASLEPRLSRIVLVVPADVDRATPTIRRDGSEVARPAWGRAIPIDPGPHTIEVAAPGFQTWTATVTVPSDGSRTEVVVPALVRVEVAAPPPVVPPPLVPKLAPPRPAAAPPPDDAAMAPGRVAGWVVAGTGVTMLGVATGLGIATLSIDAASDALCEPECTTHGYDLNQQAQRTADASTGLFIAGAITAAVGVGLVVAF